MSDFTHYRAVVAALSRHGAAPEVVEAARRDLSAARARARALRVIDGERAALGLPPLSDGLADVVTRAAFLGLEEAA